VGACASLEEGRWNQGEEEEQEMEKIKREFQEEAVGRPTVLVFGTTGRREKK
jgi:hypothetical protein